MAQPRPPWDHHGGSLQAKSRGGLDLGKYPPLMTSGSSSVRVGRPVSLVTPHTCIIDVPQDLWPLCCVSPPSPHVLPRPLVPAATVRKGLPIPRVLQRRAEARHPHPTTTCCEGNVNPPGGADGYWHTCVHNSWSLFAPLVTHQDFMSGNTDTMHLATCPFNDLRVGSTSSLLPAGARVNGMLVEAPSSITDSRRLPGSIPCPRLMYWPAAGWIVVVFLSTSCSIAHARSSSTNFRVDPSGRLLNLSTVVGSIHATRATVTPSFDVTFTPCIMSSLNTGKLSSSTTSSLCVCLRIGFPIEPADA